MFLINCIALKRLSFHYYIRLYKLEVLNKKGVFVWLGEVLLE